MFGLDIPWKEIWNDILDVLLWWPRRVFEMLMQGLVELLAAIPVPDFIQQIPGNLGDLVEGIGWGFWLFNVPAGLGIIISAYLLRFLIRRLPFIG